MDLEKKAILLLVPILMVSMATVLLADYAQTDVLFLVQTSTAFRVSLPGLGPVGSNGTIPPSAPFTSDINFSSNTGTENNIVPCVAGGGTCQSSEGNNGVPIFQYDNTGTTNISVTLIFNESLPTGVTVRGNSTWNKTSLSNGTFYNGSSGHTSSDFAVNSTELAIAAVDIAWDADSFLNVYLYANFTGVAGGSSWRLMNHTSASSG